jgi:hypothetical protein
MPKFESPLGSKSFSAQPLKEFDVPDESGYSEPSNPIPVPKQRTVAVPNEDDLRSFQSRMEEQEESPAEVERQIKQSKLARHGKERLNDGARRRIEMLVGMTRSSREVAIGENTFVLQTLKSKEMREAMMVASEFDGTIQSPFEIRRQLLGRSIKQVAGVDIEQFVGSSALEARFTFVDEQDDTLLNRLYEEYLILVREAKDKFAIKTEAEAKEVIEDLKK